MKIDTYGPHFNEWGFTVNWKPQQWDMILITILCFTICIYWEE